MAVALIAAVSVQAQDLTDNYQKIYAGWTNFKVFDRSEAKALNGFNLGYAYAFNITGHNAPLFLELGAEYAYMTATDGGETAKYHSAQIPLNITYKFGNENFSVAPFIGESLRFNMTYKQGDSDLMDDENAQTVQPLFNCGVNFVIGGHLQIGYRFQASNIKLVDNDRNKNDFSNNISVGYVF